MDGKQFSISDDAASSSSGAFGVSSPIWSDPEAAFYARGLAGSDYAEKVGPVLRRLLGRPTSLLDVGAGDGPFGRMLVGPDGRWTCVEPNRFMVESLARDQLHPPTQIIADVWQNLPLRGLAANELCHDAVLATNVGGPIGETLAFVGAMRRLARHTFCWSISAQNGPRKFCLSGFLPPELHGEDVTPGVDLVLDQLGSECQPERQERVEWSFRATFADFDAAERHFIYQFSLHGATQQRLLYAWLREHLLQTDAGWVASAPKTSAVLIWRTNTKGELS